MSEVGQTEPFGQISDRSALLRTTDFIGWLRFDWNVP
jgi:hypothetical protein